MGTDRLIEHQHRMAQVRRLIRESKRYVRLNEAHIVAAREILEESRQPLAALRQRLRTQPPPR